jgi:hypothetical protein
MVGKQTDQRKVIQLTGQIYYFSYNASYVQLPLFKNAAPYVVAFGKKGVFTV